VSAEYSTSIKPRLLDLFCGAGGAAMGYSRAGFDVVGIDIAPQPHYPFEFKNADVMEVMKDCGRWVRSFDAIHASPPCQHYSDLGKRNGNADDWPDLIGPVRDKLLRIGLPYVIENVDGAPLIDPVILCGVSFPELRVIRHRLFESNVSLVAAPHKTHPLVFTHDKRKAHYGRLDQDTAYVSVNGGGNCRVTNKRDAMGVPWMNGKEANEAIPPAYTEFIGRQLMAQIGAKPKRRRRCVECGEPIEPGESFELNIHDKCADIRERRPHE
jgi:DNA (cytosine-5)-methyltransferase 1